MFYGRKKIKNIKKAKELFLIYGVKKTTVDEIAKAAGIGKGTVYLYFSSKDDIVSDLAIQEANSIASQLDKVISHLFQQSLKEMIWIKKAIIS